MRLSTEPDRDDDRSVAVLHAAFDAGVTLLDTADAYCSDGDDAGHNERLIARALATWTGDRSRIRGGHQRAGSRGRRADGSRRPRATPDRGVRSQLSRARRRTHSSLSAARSRSSDTAATSVRALAALKRDGLIGVIGLCNVNVGQIEEAPRITEIDADPGRAERLAGRATSSAASPDTASAHDMPLLAHRPLGGLHRPHADADRSGCCASRRAARGDPFEIAIAWLDRSLTPVIPLPGATRVETAQSIARASAITADRRRPRADSTRDSRRARVSAARSAASRPAALRSATPKSCSSWACPERVRARPRSVCRRRLRALNRDDAGGSLSDLSPGSSTRAIAAGASRIVLDNTYVSRQSRAPRRSPPPRSAGCRRDASGCRPASRTRRSTRCSASWPDTAGCSSPKRCATIAKRDVAAFGPGVQFRYQRELEPPDPSEGFSRIDETPFERIATAPSVSEP